MTVNDDIYMRCKLNTQACSTLRDVEASSFIDAEMASWAWVTNILQDER